MAKTSRISLLISTYNWPEALDLVLKSAIHQSVAPNEILIADDGSTHETKRIIEHYKKLSSTPINHIWHEDDGFRRTVILNKAIAEADGNYIVQVDGDCILHRHFIEDHINSSENNVFLFGSRVSIKESYLPKLFKTKNVHFKFSNKGIKKRSRNLRFQALRKFYRPKNELSSKLRGCNLSFWKEDFIAINGYNEAMTGWGREDSEMAIRLLNNGVKGKRVRYGAIVYHIWHLVKSKERVNINEKIQQEAKDKKHVYCENGISKYL